MYLILIHSTSLILEVHGRNHELVHLDAAAVQLASRRAWQLASIWAWGGQLSLIIWASAKSCIHADNNGNLSSCTIFRPAMSFNMLIKLSSQPNARSTNLMVSSCHEFFRVSISRILPSSCYFPCLMKTPWTDVKPYTKTNSHVANYKAFLKAVSSEEKLERTTFLSPNLAQKHALTFW